MAIPDYQSIMLPLLRFAEDKNEHSLHEAVEFLANRFSLTETNLQELLPSGKQPIFINRVGWARTYLSKAGLLTPTKRGFFQISSRGVEILSQNPTRIDNKTLKQFPEFNEFQKRKNGKTERLEFEIQEDNRKTPEESLETAYQTIRNALATEILGKVKSCSPSFFERLVVELLVAMGYGGTLQDAGKAATAELMELSRKTVWVWT